MPASLPLLLRPPTREELAQKTGSSPVPVAGGRLVLHPRYRTWLMRAGITSAAAALELPGEIVCGHPDRHVVRVNLGGRTVYLKREHTVGLRVRFRNAKAKFGWISRSEREAITLRNLESAGLPGPQWLAYGEDQHGRAFLLVDELSGSEDIRRVLSDNPMSLADRRVLAERVGRALAELHEAGFSTPEAAAKHLFVSRRGAGITLIDWQSAPPIGIVGTDSRIRQLALLHATLADSLASTQERFRMLWAYRRVVRQSRGATGERLPSFSTMVKAIAELTEKLKERSSVRDQRAVPTNAQRLVWLAGEQVCAVPDVASVWPTPPTGEPFYSSQPVPGWVSHEWITFADGRRSLLTRFRTFAPIGRFLAGIRGKSWRSPAAIANRILFHLDRHGIAAPRLLAFGQRLTTGCQSDSFVVVEPLTDTIPVAEWSGCDSDRRELLRRCGELLRTLHDSGLRLTANAGKDPSFVVLPNGEIGLDSPFVVRLSKRIGEISRWIDMNRLTRRIWPNLSRTDRLRVIRAYANARTPE